MNSNCKSNTFTCTSLWIYYKFKNMWNLLTYITINNVPFFLMNILIYIVYTMNVYTCKNILHIHNYTTLGKILCTYYYISRLKIDQQNKILSFQAGSSSGKDDLTERSWLGISFAGTWERNYCYKDIRYGCAYTTPGVTEDDESVTYYFADWYTRARKLTREIRFYILEGRRARTYT